MLNVCDSFPSQLVFDTKAAKDQVFSFIDLLYRQDGNSERNALHWGYTPNPVAQFLNHK